MADWVCASKFDDHDMELIKIAVLYDKASEDIKSQIRAVLEGRELPSSDSQERNHTQA